MRAKDILGKSNGILFTKYGELPHLARSNWNLWRLVKDLNKNEIKVLITSKIKQLKRAKTDDEIKEIRRDIVLLSDAYKIKNRHPNIDFNETETQIIQILDMMGFTQSFYKNEALNLLAKLVRYDKIFNNIPVYVVLIVLDHHNATYTFDDIIYFIDDNYLINYNNFKLWCDKYYWEDSLI